MTKEDFIENVLNSTNGITQVAPNDDLYEKINQKINKTKVVPLKTLWLVAASIILLIGLNLILINNQNSAAKNQTASFEKSLNQDNQLYN
ncbi:hypothetical protein OX283_002335 [Flavobacterium sp. SUN052]|uniref:hypothetical protein n=1 Tax=Flavobacterium sp. SUN052 TaxID=3002441 RepID=UPI00237ECF01|nr:hypothetical protein [Flavobacterium sp. SUN052]MEC4003483.1 hypothetical protein [Flavobacterium sp. SUN052]